jgi:phosphoribosylanthranilate isomerase
MIVKICGVTTVEDALMSAEAGADMIGLNFYPKSPRLLTREKATAIANQLRTRSLPKPPTLVGVFVNETADFMKSVLDECGIDLAQLSGDEPAEVLQAMGGQGFKAIRQTPKPTAHAAKSLLLFDAHAAGQYGGTGKTADWESAARLAMEWRLLLAGGLTSENVAAAVAHVRPWGVDVASGVESAPGVKDRSKVFSFIERAKNA